MENGCLAGNPQEIMNSELLSTSTYIGSWHTPQLYTKHYMYTGKEKTGQSTANYTIARAMCGKFGHKLPDIDAQFCLIKWMHEEEYRGGITLQIL